MNRKCEDTKERRYLTVLFLNVHQQISVPADLLSFKSWNFQQIKRKQTHIRCVTAELLWFHLSMNKKVRTDALLLNMTWMLQLCQRRKQATVCQPRMYHALHKHTRLINGKWWHGTARLGSAQLISSGGCIGTEESESPEGESSWKQGRRGGWRTLQSRSGF